MLLLSLLLHYWLLFFLVVGRNLHTYLAPYRRVFHEGWEAIGLSMGTCHPRGTELDLHRWLQDGAWGVLVPGHRLHGWLGHRRTQHPAGVSDWLFFFQWAFQVPKSVVPIFNGHLRNLNWRYLPYIRPIFQAYVRGYTPKICLLYGTVAPIDLKWPLRSPKRWGFNRQRGFNDPTWQF